MPRNPDATVAMDDILTERWPAGCTMCQRWPLWTVHTRAVHGLVVGASLCLRCHKQDPQQVRLDALLAARYDPARWDGRRPA
jgi:hypothetical protein